MNSMEERWHSIEDRPLFTKNDRGQWATTQDGDQDFIAAIETNKGWWIRHCVVEDQIGLCVVGDDCNEPAGWELEDVMYWMPMPKAPKKSNVELTGSAGQNNEV